MHFFWQMREEERWDFVTQEAQSVSAHWCSELAGLSLWSPINSAVRLLPRHTACSYAPPTAAPGNTCLSLPPDLGQTHSTAPPCPHTFLLPYTSSGQSPHLTNNGANSLHFLRGMHFAFYLYHLFLMISQFKFNAELNQK